VLTMVMVVATGRLRLAPPCTQVRSSLLRRFISISEVLLVQRQLTGGTARALTRTGILRAATLPVMVVVTVRSEELG